MRLALLISLIVGPFAPLSAQGPDSSLPPSAELFHAALDTVAAIIRAGNGVIPPESNARVYLREGYFRSNGSIVQEVELPRVMIDSLRKTRHLAGTCALGSGFCDRAISGHLLSAWSPMPTFEHLVLTIDDQLLQSERPACSRAAPPSHQTARRWRRESAFAQRSFARALSLYISPPTAREPGTSAV